MTRADMDMAVAANREGEPHRALFAPGPRRFRVMFVQAPSPPRRRCAGAAAAEFAAREEAARAAAAARGGALVRGAGGSCARFTTGFGISFTIFFGFGFGLCGVISTTFGFGAGGKLRHRDRLLAARPLRAAPLSFAVLG